MKRIWASILVVIMLVSLCSCGSNDGQQLGMQHSVVETQTPTDGEATEEYWSETAAPTELPVETEPSGYLPEDEYDEIIARDERYLLCKKIESGFDVNAVCYGIYDSQEQSWALDYKEYEDISDEDIVAHGDGMFSYDYLGNTGSMRAYFLSANLGGGFKTDNPAQRETVTFKDGKALVLISQDTYYVGGAISPHTKLCWLTVYGEYEDVSIPGFAEDDMLYWKEVNWAKDNKDALWAMGVESYQTDIEYLCVYIYEDRSFVIIDDETYTTRLTYGGGYTEQSSIVLNGELIRINNLEGDNGEQYYAEFDKAGNLVTAATPMY